MIQTSDSSRIYVGNNSTSVPYPVPFKFHFDEDLVVVVKDETGMEDAQLLGTDYTVLGAGAPDGGSITTTWAVPATSHVSIARVVPMTQLTAYEEGDSFPAKSHEKALDKLTMEVQQLARGMGSGDADGLGTSFRVTDASGGFPAVPKRNDSTLGVDPHGMAVLRTPSEMLSWLGQVGTVWEDDAERANTRAAYKGQLGVQNNNQAVYVSMSTAPGDWQPFLLFDGVVTSVDGVPGAKNNPEGDIVGTIEAQVIYNKTLQQPMIVDPTGLDKGDVGLGNVDNTSDASKPPSDAVSNLLLTKQSTSEKGIANGYASLDTSIKVPLEQLPTSVLGASLYKGTWNANTNSPAIPTAAVGNTGWYYVVSVAGTTSINGVTPWVVGDYIMSNGTAWQKVPTTGGVTSVNTKTGSVVLVPGDIGLGNVNNTSDATKNSAVATLTNKTINGANNTLTVRLGSDVTGSLPVINLNSGTGAAPNTWWCGDGSWKTPAGTGDMVGPPLSVDSEVALYSGITGKLIKRATGTGIVNVSNGVYQTPAPITSLSPPGAIIDFAGINEPSGWFFCDGRSLYQADYPPLYSAIGQTYGEGVVPELIYEKHAVAFNPGTSYTLPGVAFSGANRLLLVWIVAAEIVGGASVTPPNAITTVTFGGTAMTKVGGTAFYYSAGLPYGEISCWRLINPPTTGDLVVTFPSADFRDFVVSAQGLTGVHQTTPLGTIEIQTGTSYATGVGIEVPSSPGNRVIDAHFWYLTNGAYYPTASGQYQIMAAQDLTLPDNSGLRCSQRLAETDATTGMSWNQPNQIGTIMGVAVKGTGVASFNIPDLRGLVTAGRDYTGVREFGYLGAVTRNCSTTGSDPYLNTITPDISTPYDLCIGMYVEGPGVSPNTYIASFYDAVTIQLNQNTAAVSTNAAYRFFLIDGTKAGSIGGVQTHLLSSLEMPAHRHQMGWGVTLAYGSNYYAPVYIPGAYNFNTLDAGYDRPHRNLQPTMIMNKIIKY